METVKDPLVQDPVSRESNFEKRINTVLLSVSTAMILITVNFLWNLKGDFSAMQERDKERGDQIGTVQGSMNKMQMDIQELKERTTRIETLQQEHNK